MKKPLYRAALLGALLPLFLLTGRTPAPAQSPPEALTWPQLQHLTRPWTGKLTYLDYRSGQPVTLPTKLQGRRSSERELTLDFTYQEPNGQLVLGSDTLKLSVDGRAVTWDGVVLQLRQNTVLPDQGRQFVLEGEGQDDGKSCRIRKTLVLSLSQVSIKKEVSFITAKGYITRNTYFFEKHQ